MSIPSLIGRTPDHALLAAQLRIGQTILVLQQNEIKALEAASDVQRDSPLVHSVGWINYAQQRWPVYCLSDQLTLTNDVPSERRACVLLAANPGYIAILCDDVVASKREITQTYEVPPAMRTRNTPIRALVPLEDNFGCLTSAERFASYVIHLAGI